MRSYELHGLIFRSDLELDASVVPEERPYDWLVSVAGNAAVGEGPPEGEVLAERTFPNGLGYAVTQLDNVKIFRFYKTADFRIFPNERRIETSLDPSSNAAIAALLVGGTLAATLLILAGRCVLHASAVVRDGSAVAFIGNSGTGKSTMAALCCRAGASLISDDALRVESTLGQAWCYSGTKNIRLRSAAASLSEDFSPDRIHSTIDQRIAIRTETITSKFPLLAAIIPQPSHSVESLRLNRLTPGESLLHFHGYARASGWRSQAVIRGQFEILAQIAAQVPLFKAEIPWGPPFSSDIPNFLLRELAFALPA